MSHARASFCTGEVPYSAFLGRIRSALGQRRAEGRLLQEPWPARRDECQRCCYWSRRAAHTPNGRMADRASPPRNQPVGILVQLHMRPAGRSWGTVLIGGILGIAGCSTSTTPSALHGTHVKSTTPSGSKVVSYKGVHVDVPAGWPVVDGMHTLFCGGPFPVTPTAFVGPNDNGAPSCPALRADQLPSRDGVWLQSGMPPSTGTEPVTTPAGRSLLEALPDSSSSDVEELWYHGVDIRIGVGPDPHASRAILESIGYTGGAPDTPASGVCARTTDPTIMPTPERLTTTLELERGAITLAPPLASDAATTSPQQVWKESGPDQWFEHYYLILARFTSKFPATVGPNGLTPLEQNVLAWVTYSVPNTPTSGCGGWGVLAYDAHTGKNIEDESYGPGP
jgi:hypothetical protein